MDLTAMNRTTGNTIAQIIEPLRLEKYGKERVYFGLGDYQGRRFIIQFPVYFSEIPALIPVINRPVNATHVKEIKDYIISHIQSKKAWILGSLTVNVNKNDISYQSIGSHLYVVRIPNSTAMQVTDGQHRIRAIAELMALDEYRSLIAEEQIPLMLVLDSNPKQAALDFRDMALGQSLPEAMLVAFNSEGRDAIAQAVARKVHLFRNSTEWFKSSPGTGTKNIYALNYIAGLVGCAKAGDANAQLVEYDTPESIDEVATTLSEWLNDFFSYCPCTAGLVDRCELTVADVAHFKSNSILALNIGLEILGHLIHREPATSVQLATQIDWSKTSPLWRNLITSPESSAGKVRVKAHSGASLTEVVDIAIAHLQMRSLWKS